MQNIISVLTLIILCITVYCIYIAPIKAVKIGRQLNNEEKKDNSKHSLFLLLFSLRGSPLHYDFVRGLNQIDIVFEDNPDVLNLWHIYYDSLHQKNQINVVDIWERQRVSLLSAMAVALGYRKLQQTDILKNYYPEGHDNDYMENQDYKQAQLMYLKAGAVAFQLMIDSAQIKTEPEKPEITKN